jgi:hypothetical protein
VIVYERRASAVLYNLLRSKRDGRRPILVPANVCPLVPLVIRKARRPCIFVDLEWPSLVIDRRQCLEWARWRPSVIGGVLYVRPYGADPAPAGFFAELRGLQPDLLLIDDAGLARPCVESGAVAPDADATLFSTGRAKWVDLGFGGFAILGDRVPYLRHPQPFSPQALARVEVWCKAGCAAGEPIGVAEEDWLEHEAPAMPWDAYRDALLMECARAAGHKALLNGIYSQSLPAEIQLPEPLQGWRFQILVPRPQALLARLEADGLFASRHYASADALFGGGPFPVARRLYARVVNLFNDKRYDEERAHRSSTHVRQHLSARGRE